MSELRKAVSDAIWAVMHGYDGQLLTGDFYPGHDAIVDAAMGALGSRPALPPLAEGWEWIAQPIAERWPPYEEG